jgi:hypothetical protein
MSEMVNIEQIRVMKHAIGIRKDRIKRGVYKAFRNYFLVSISQDDWEDLVSKGYAEVDRKGGFNGDKVVYYVTRQGLDLLEELTFVKIKEDVE